MLIILYVQLIFFCVPFDRNNYKCAIGLAVVFNLFFHALMW